MVIAHNLTAMNASRQYGLVTSSKAKSTEKLSSGYKINRAADDAAGLTISEKMRSLIRGLNQGSDNIQDGISLIQIADGALSEVNDMLHRMTELSVKSANGTNTDADRQAIQEEINEIVKEIDRISKSTEYNTMPLLADKTRGKMEGAVTNLVTSPAATSGYLTETYQGHASASLDFSGVTASNIKRLNGQGFSFNCSANCREVFDIRFATDGRPSSVVGQNNGQQPHYYTVDISGCKNGTEIVNKIYDYVTTNAPNGYSGNLVSHSNKISKEGSKIIISATGGYTYPRPGLPNSGKIDCSSLTSLLADEKKNEFWIQCSNNEEDGISIEVPWMNSTILGINGANVTTELTAKNLIGAIGRAGDKVSSMRSELGAYQNRLEHAYDNNNNKAENTTAAESRIRDTDMAAEMVKLSMQNILQQAGEAMMSRANQSTQSVLSLLQ